MKNFTTNVETSQERSRVVAFGDSITFGQGFEDCYVPWTKDRKSGPGKECSKFAYPQLIGNELSIPVLNNSSPGASNRQILHSIYSFDFEPGDLVLVGWSFFERDFYFSDKSIKNDLKAGPWTDMTELVHSGYIYRGKLEQFSRSAEMVIAGYSYLLNLNLELFSFCIDAHTFVNDWVKQLYLKTKNQRGNNIIGKQLKLLHRSLPNQELYNKCYSLCRKYDDWALDKDDPSMREAHPGKRTHGALTYHIVNKTDLI